MQALQQWTQDNYELIGMVVIGVGNTMLTIAKMGLELGTPLLQQLVN